MSYATRPIFEIVKDFDPQTDFTIFYWECGDRRSEINFSTERECMMDALSYLFEMVKTPEFNASNIKY